MKGRTVAPWLQFVILLSCILGVPALTREAARPMYRALGELTWFAISAVVGSYVADWILRALVRGELRTPFSEGD